MDSLQLRNSNIIFREMVQGAHKAYVHHYKTWQRFQHRLVAIENLNIIFCEMVEGVHKAIAKRLDRYYVQALGSHQSSQSKSQTTLISCWIGLSSIIIRQAPRFKFNDLWPKSQTSSNMSTLSGWPHWETLILGRWTGSITNWKLRKLWSDVGLRKRREHWIASQSGLTTRSNHWRTQKTAYSFESRKNEILFNWSFVDHKYCFVSLKKCIRRVGICESMLETKTTNPSPNRLKRSSKETETKFGASNLIRVNKSPLTLTIVREALIHFQNI